MEGNLDVDPSAESDSIAFQRQLWEREQEQLKSRLILHDDFSWTLPPKMSGIGEPSGMNPSTSQMGNWLQYIGGVDVSFSKTNPSVALGALVVLNVDNLEVIYEKFETVDLKLPYVPGFLAFRECPVLLKLLSQMASSAIDLYPQLLMVDGNGILHPKGFGLASHLGVLVDIPTIGVGKNLHHIDGLTDAEVRLRASKSNTSAGDTIPLIGKSGKTWGAALKSNESSNKPIFVSIGHRICLASATAIVQHCCRYRVPEPIRQADIRSREQLRLMGHDAI